MPVTAPRTRNRSSNITSGAEASGRDDTPDTSDTGKQRPQPTESRMNRIAARAHAIYEARGGEHGHALDDWLQAEREIDAEIQEERGKDTGPGQSERR
jgi:hypothetical protein